MADIMTRIRKQILPILFILSKTAYVKEQRTFYHRTFRPEPKLDSKLFTRCPGESH